MRTCIWSVSSLRGATTMRSSQTTTVFWGWEQIRKATATGIAMISSCDRNFNELGLIAQTDVQRFKLELYMYFNMCMISWFAFLYWNCRVLQYFPISRESVVAQIVFEFIIFQAHGNSNKAMKDPRDRDDGVCQRSRITCIRSSPSIRLHRHQAAPLDRASFRGFVLGCIEAKFFK